jgi:pimeloyl-ACP methyl ester carboxylesterase
MRRRAKRGRFVVLGRQGVRSSYVGLFHLPGVQVAARRSHRILDRTRGRWAATLRRVDGARTDLDWPAPTFGRDLGNGMALYRANFGDRLRRSRPLRPSDVPVLLIQPTRDRFVPPWLFEGIEEVAPDVRRVDIDAHHWVVRSDPAGIAGLIAEHVDAHPVLPVAAT